MVSKKNKILLFRPPFYEDNGNPNLLTQSIYTDKDWSMVFAAENEAVFVKNELNQKLYPTH